MINSLCMEMRLGYPSKIIDSILITIERDINQNLIDVFSEYLSDIPDYTDNGRKCFDMKSIIGWTLINDSSN